MKNMKKKQKAASKTVSFRLNLAEKKLVRELADKEGISEAKFLENIVKPYVKEHTSNLIKTNTKVGIIKETEIKNILPDLFLEDTSQINKKTIVNIAIADISLEEISTKDTTTENKVLNTNNTNVVELKQEVIKSVSLDDVSIKNRRISLPNLADIDLAGQNLRNTPKIIPKKILDLPSLDEEDEVDEAKKQEIIKCIETHIKKVSFMDVFWGYGAWYIGVTKRPHIRRQQHGHPEKWMFWKLENPITAREVEKYFLEKGMKGSSGGGTNTIYVYVF